MSLSNAPVAGAAPGGGAAAAPLLSVDHLAIDVAHGQGRSTRIVDDVSFSLDAGQALAIVGESGSGKTLTGLSLMGLLPQVASVAQGSITFDGQDLATLPARQFETLRGGQISMVFQDPLSSLNPLRRVGTVMTETIMRHQGLSRAEATAMGIDYFARVGIAAPAERYREFPHQLSGGMRQRVMIALAIVNQPTLLIADEPTTALDATIQMQVLSLIKELTERSALIIITHDLGVAAQVADRVLVMYAGRVMEYGDVQTVLRGGRHPYTRGLIGARPQLGAEGAGLVPIPGAPLKAADRTQACPFMARCAHVTPACEGHTPLQLLGPTHAVACQHPLSERS